MILLWNSGSRKKVKIKRLCRFICVFTEKIVVIRDTQFLRVLASLRHSLLLRNKKEEKCRIIGKIRFGHFSIFWFGRMAFRLPMFYLVLSLFNYFINVVSQFLQIFDQWSRFQKIFSVLMLWDIWTKWTYFFKKL